jgi:hypothetical protein
MEKDSWIGDRKKHDDFRRRQSGVQLEGIFYREIGSNEELSRKKWGHLWTDGMNVADTVVPGVSFPLGSNRQRRHPKRIIQRGLDI